MDWSISCFVRAILTDGTDVGSGGGEDGRGWSGDVVLEGVGKVFICPYCLGIAGPERPFVLCLAVERIELMIAGDRWPGPDSCLLFSRA